MVRAKKLKIDRKFNLLSVLSPILITLFFSCKSDKLNSHIYYENLKNDFAALCEFSDSTVTSNGDTFYFYTNYDAGHFITRPRSLFKLNQNSDKQVVIFEGDTLSNKIYGNYDTLNLMRLKRKGVNIVVKHPLGKVLKFPHCIISFEADTLLQSAYGTLTPVVYKKVKGDSLYLTLVDSNRLLHKITFSLNEFIQLNRKERELQIGQFYLKSAGISVTNKFSFRPEKYRIPNGNPSM